MSSRDFVELTGMTTPRAKGCSNTGFQVSRQACCLVFKTTSMGIRLFSYHLGRFLNKAVGLLECHKIFS